MKKIKKLSKEIIEQFTPLKNKDNLAFILKEILENSCDANSTKIIVHIDNTQTKGSIKVIDNGFGINKINLKYIGSQNKTNKISSLTDLKNIRLYGFKGESLFIIRNLYNIEIISRAYGQRSTHKLWLNKKTRKIKTHNTISHQGTITTIKNIPHLKNIQNLSGLYAVLKRVALPNPHIHFILYKNSIEQLNFPACKNTLDSKLRIKNILKNKQLDTSIDIKHTYKNMHFTGFITFNKHKKKAPFKYFFINNRFLKCKILEDVIADIINTLNLKISLGFYITLKTRLNIFNIKLTANKNKVYFKNNNVLRNIFTTIINLHIHEHKKFFHINNNTKKILELKNIPDDKYNNINETLITNDNYYVQKNKILTIIDNNTIIFILKNKVYAVTLKKMRAKLILKDCIDQFIKNNNLKQANLINKKCYNIKKKYYIIKHYEFFKMYGFNLQILNANNVLVQAVPDLLKSFSINWENLINEMITYISNSFALYFSKNRFDINIIKIFINNIHPESRCYTHELKRLYKEIIYTKKNDKTWFKKNCKKIYSKKGQ